MKENEIIIFEAEDKSITLPVSVKTTRYGSALI